MKKAPVSKSAFFNSRALIGLSFCLVGLFLALLAFAAYPGGNAFAKQEKAALVSADSAANSLALSNSELVPEANLDQSTPQVPFAYTEKAPYPMFNGLDRHATATFNNFLYVLGGESLIGTTFGVTNVVERFDPAANTWAVMAPMPVALSNIEACAMNGKIYIPGGYDGTAVVATNYIYDIASNTWSTGAAVPAPATVWAVVACDGAANKMYVIAGYDLVGAAGTTATKIYDATANTWSAGAVLPASRYGADGGLINGKIYVAGGADPSGAATTAVSAYTISTNTWATVAPMSIGCIFGAAGVDASNRLWITGGGFCSNAAVATGRTERYDPVANTWTTTADVLNEVVRHTNGGIAGASNTLFNVVGGATGVGTTTIVNTQQAAVTGGPSPTPSATPTVPPATPSPTAPAATPTPSASASPAGNYYFSGALATSDSTFVNPGGSTAGTGRQYYDVFQFTVATTGPHTFEVSSRNTNAAGQTSNALDTFYRIYAGTFDPTAPGAGLANNDDFTGTLTVLPGPYTVNGVTNTGTGFTNAQPSSRMPTVNLTAGVQYFLITTSFRSTDYVPTATTNPEGGPTGPYWAGISPGDIIPTGVPSPTPSASPSASAIATPSPSASASATAPASPTVAPSATVSGTATPAASCTPGGSPGPWATAAPSPGPRYRSGGATDGTNVYVFGGANGAVLLNDLWRWSPATQTWTQLANMPTAKQNIQGTYWNGKIYVPGGFTTAHITENAIYDIASNTWSTGAALPTAQTGTTVAFNNKIYNIGGNPGPQTTVSIYDIASNTWSSGAPMPVATTYGRAIAVGNFAYYVGGIQAVTTNTVYRYDFAANTWSTMAPLQTARTSEELMASPDGTLIYAVMGGDATFFEGVPLAQTVEIYNIAGNTWTFGPPVVTTAAGSSGGIAGGKLMVEGGTTMTTYINTVQVSQLQGGCASPAPSLTPGITPTPTPTPTASASPCGATSTFTNSTAITLTDCPSGCAAPQPASLYPSNIAVSGVSGAVSKVTVTITGWNHTFPGDNDMLLVGPGGQKFIVLSDALTSADTTGQTYTFDDTAAAVMPSSPTTAPASGSFKPTNYTTGDIFPAPAPAGPYLSPGTAGTDMLTAFNGVDPNGTWSLYIVDDANIDSGTLTGGWSLSITTAAACGTPTPSPTITPGSTTPTPSPTCAPGLTEVFDDITTLPAAGWVQTNHSNTIGTTGWFQGNDTVFPSHSGATISYIGANFNNTTATNTISNWLLTPPQTLVNGATMTFWTRTTTANPFPDRLQVRMSTNGTSSNVGTTATDVGDFTTLLLDIDPTYTVGGYPEDWMQFTVTVTGVPTATQGRLAFRYFVENGGPTGSNSNYIGIDDFQFNGVCTSPSPTIAPSATPSIAPSIAPSATPSVAPSIGPSATPSVAPSAGPSATVGASATPGVSPPSQAVNLSTRMRVQTGDKVGIGGFIITGASSKNVIIRAIGPSLTRYGIVDVLADPVLELHGPAGFTTIINNNWRETQQAAIVATGIPPTNDLESAIVATLAPGPYTAIVKGNGGTSGVALVEVYDLSPGSGKLANLATRAFVSTGDNIVIAGFLLSADGSDDSVVIRGIGPSLSAAGVAGALADPTLELRDHNGTLLIANNDWQDNAAQAAAVIAAGLAPSNNLESAIAASLPPGLYTALLTGLNNGQGIGLVEVYDRGAGGPVPSATPGLPSPTPVASPVASATPGASPGATPTPPTSSPTPPSASPTPTPPAAVCTENFDGVTAPALPAGWVATLAAGDPPSWETSATSPDSPPNDAFVVDQDGISDKMLDSRDIVINSTTAQISFRNNFNTEHDPPPAEVFWDGYVMEVSINGGAFDDVITGPAGGTFVSGPYTGEIDGTANNPLAGRMAWSGNSGGYINTVINLPASLNGQTIKLRFRMGTDEAQAATGARVDGLTVNGGSCP